MEPIIIKAIEGGWRDKPTYPEFREKWIAWLAAWRKHEIVCDPLFWASLGKACGWDEYIGDKFKITGWASKAMNFQKINYTEGWDAAIKYLQGVINA